MQTPVRACFDSRPLYLRQMVLAAGAALLLTASALGQNAACSPAAPRTLTDADAAYEAKKFAQAETLYREELKLQPRDVGIAAGLIQTLLHEGEVTQAAAEAKQLTSDNPQSAVALTALAEVQVREGLPWSALATLDAATAIEPCTARIPLVRSRIDRLDSMYGSERREIQKAYEIDPADPDVRHAWTTVVAPANDIRSIESALATMKDVDDATRQKAEASAHGMLSLLRESSQTCQVQPTASSATLPLMPSMDDGKHIDGYRLQVQLPKTKASLQVDTAASGLYISRALADANGLEPGPGSAPGTVHADSIRIGPLEFRDCMVGVSETPFGGNAEGFIGTDLFASYLITLDHSQGKLGLAPLPALASPLPEDRPDAPELKDYVPVYHRLQFLLVPVVLNNKERRLFLLDTGIRLSTMTSEAAHAVSTTRMNFTNAVQTKSGGTLQVYRDSFDLRFANLSVPNWGHILQFDPSSIEESSGLRIGGMLGFDLLQSMVLHLDYRDGLVKFDSFDTKITADLNIASRNRQQLPEDDCRLDQPPTGTPLTSTIAAQTTGLFDSGQLKVGQKIWLKVVHEWAAPFCRLSEGTTVYGHVTAAHSAKGSGSSELGLVFDRADCVGHEKEEVSFPVLGMLSAPDAYQGMQDDMPSKVSGNGRSISQTVAAMNYEDQNMNPSGPPDTMRAGFVGGLPKITLTPGVGKGCAALLRSTEPAIRLGAGTTLILTARSATP